MAVSLKQKWLRILTQIAENTQDSKIAIQAIALGLAVQNAQKTPNKKLNKQLEVIFGGQKMTKPQDKPVEKPDK